MYKKITHTIVEEHFDHPIANQIKKSMEKSKIVTDEIFTESKFKSDVNNYFTTYTTNLMDIINSITGTEEELIIPFERVFNNAQVDDLGNATKPFYASNFGEKINESMRRMILITFNMVQQLKTGRDGRYLVDAFRNILANDLASVMSNFNYNWQFEPLNLLLNNIANQILAKMKARVKKDSTAEKLATDELVKLFNTFEQQFIDGVISQHPERFNRTATTFNNKDIM
jgi:hypothetical protein